MSRSPVKSTTHELAEFTVKAVLLGCILGVLMTAANVYLGLYAGMTVSASIPAAVISMGILRGLMRTGTILENNIVQTIASAGESLAAGIIFTMPALVITGVWKGFNFWPVTLVAVLGGMLGVLFMIPLRRALIIEEEELVYPEGVACAEVLKTGESSGSGIAFVFGALGIGAIFKFLISGLSLIASGVEGAWRIGRSAIYFGCDISPALVAVGYIVGLNVSILIFLGGAIGWAICIPVYYLFAGYPDPTGVESVVKVMSDTWDSQIRFMGVGAMIVGGLWSIVGVRHGIVKGFQGAVAAYQKRNSQETIERTSLDMDIRSIMMMFVPTAVAIFLLYRVLTGDWTVGLTAGFVMIAAAFFFVAVSSYIVGLVGSSNNPVSGMTISTMLFASALLLLFGMTGTTGVIASLGIAGVVCCAACTAGDVSQDLKTGHLVGATPRKTTMGPGHRRLGSGLCNCSYLDHPPLCLRNRCRSQRRSRIPQSPASKPLRRNRQRDVHGRRSHAMDHGGNRGRNRHLPDRARFHTQSSRQQVPYLCHARGGWHLSAMVAWRADLLRRTRRLADGTILRRRRNRQSGRPPRRVDRLRAHRR